MNEAAQRALLAELADYLARLPLHPMHQAMRLRIEAQLVGPAPTPPPLVGSRYTPAGQCLLVAQLEGATLTVSVDQHHDTPEFAALRLRNLYSGIAVDLAPPRA